MCVLANTVNLPTNQGILPQTKFMEIQTKDAAFKTIKMCSQGLIPAHSIE